MNAPEIGARVVYVERAAVGGGSGPDRQFLVSFTRKADSGPMSAQFATGSILQPADLQAWTGRCQPGTELALLSDVVDMGECTFSVTMNEIRTLTITGGPMPAACVSTALDATEVKTNLLSFEDKFEWMDTLTDDAGTTSHDPPSPENSEHGYLSYQMARRTPMPSPPGSP